MENQHYCLFCVCKGMRFFQQRGYITTFFCIFANKIHSVYNWYSHYNT